MPLSSPISDDDLIEVVYHTGTVLRGLAMRGRNLDGSVSWYIPLGGKESHLIMRNEVIGEGIVDMTTVRKALPPEPPVGSIVAVTIRGTLFAMQRYEQGWYCNRHRMNDGYVLINGSTQVGAGGHARWSATPPCPNCPDTWEKMHELSSPVRILYWKGDSDE